VGCGVSKTMGSLKGATTFIMTTLSIMTLGIKGLFVTLSINDIQHNKSVIMLSVFMLSVAIFLLLC
jgi:hypothetical protein